MSDIFWQLIRVDLIPDSNKKQGYTEGVLYTENGYLCDTLEDTVRDFNADGDLLDDGEEKVWGRTAIPYGIYPLIVTYSPTFEKYMTLVDDVKHFEGVRLHWGRTQRNTRGCPLVGEKKKDGVLKNTGMTDKITKMVKKLTDKGHRVFLDVVSPID